MSPRPVKRILLIRPDAIGDVVLMIPLINAIKAYYPHASVTVLLQSYTKPLLENHPNVDHILIDRKLKNNLTSFSQFLAYSRYIRALKFDVVIFSFINLFYLLLCTLSGIPIRIGDKNKLLLRPLLSHPVKQDFRHLVRHEVEHNISLGSPLGIPQTSSLNLDLVVNSDDIHTIEHLLKKLGIIKSFIIIHPTSGGGNRAWLPKHYARLIDRINETTQFDIIVTGSTKKAHTKSTFFSLAGQTSLGELKALISKAQAIIGTDTGPTHIAAALKIPVLTISPTKFVKALRWGPWGTSNLVVGYPQHCNYACNPHVCTLPDCLDAIPVQSVLNGLVRLTSIAPDNTIAVCKHEWFRASTNFLFYYQKLDGAIRQYQLDIIRTIGQHNISIYIGFDDDALKPEFKTVFQYIKGFKQLQLSHPYTLFKYLTTHDITHFHLNKSTPGILWRYLRQLAALNMYCPPHYFYISKNKWEEIKTNLLNHLIFSDAPK